MTLDLSIVKKREALRSQREPYWQRIRPGCFFGLSTLNQRGRGNLDRSCL